MGSGETKNHAPAAAGESPHPIASYREEFKAALEESVKQLRRALLQSQQSIAAQLQAGNFGPTTPDAAEAPAQPPNMADAVGEAFRHAQELLNKVALASQEAQAAMQQPPPADPRAAAPSAAPATEQPQPTLPPNPLEATNVLMSHAVGSLNAAMQAAMQAIDLHPGKAGTWEAQAAQERRGRQ